MNPYDDVARAAADGIARAAEGAKAYRPFIRATIVVTAHAMPVLTMDEVLDVVEQYFDLRELEQGKPFKLVAYGSMFQTLQKEGVINKIEGRLRPSRRKTQHRHRQVYVSQVWSPGAKVMRGGIQPPLPEVERWAMEGGA
jgi:hypothetical protein